MKLDLLRTQLPRKSQQEPDAAAAIALFEGRDGEATPDNRALCLLTTFCWRWSELKEGPDRLERALKEAIAFVREHREQSPTPLGGSMDRNRILFIWLLACNALNGAGGELKLDPPPGERQKPYEPADNQVLEVTPPAFLWVPAGRDVRYAVQVSQRAEFPPGGTQTFAGITRSVFVPREPLRAGQWFWRYGVETKDGLAFGRARPFTIAPDVRPFSFPDFEQLSQRVPRQRPRLFFAGERLAEVRALAKGEWKSRVESLVKSCRKTVGETLVPEPDYMPKEPEKRGPWAMNIMTTTRLPMDVMEACALAYLLTGDEPCGLEAKRRLLHFFSWDPDGPTSFFAYDEPAMWMMMRGTRAYDWTYSLFMPEERAQMEPKMRTRAVQFLRQLERLPFESRPYDSHAGRLPGFLGECALSFIHDWPEARQWLQYVTLLYMTSYPAWGGDDGGWQEGPIYWSAYMDFALRFVVALRQGTGFDLMQKPFFRNTPYYALYTATPYHEHAPFGDHAADYSPARLGPVLHTFSVLTQDPHLLWFAETAGCKPGTDILAGAEFAPSFKARSPLDLPQARVFPSAGLASIHTALGDKEHDISFLLRSSPLGSVSHGHADQNAFALEAFGRGLAIATGTYPWYGSPHHVQWTRATRAVNSILVDGQGQVDSDFNASGRIGAFVHGAGYDYVEGDAAAAYGGRLTKFLRQVVHVRPGVFVMLDDLAAPKPATFQWLLHAYQKIDMDEEDRILYVRRQPAAMEVRLLLPTELVFSQTDRYEPEPEKLRGPDPGKIRGDIPNTWHLTAGTPAAATTAQFLTVLLPHRVGGETNLPRSGLLEGDGALGVRLTWPDGSEDIVAFRTDPASKTVACAGLTSDARVFACGRKADGTGSRRLCLEGTKLEVVAER